MNADRSILGLYIDSADNQGHIVFGVYYDGSPQNLTQADRFSKGCVLVDHNTGAHYVNLGLFSAPQWYEMPSSGGESYRTQASWFIDPVSGLDSNNGSTSGTALKTWSEILRRLPKGEIQQNTTFTFLGDLPDTDPLDVSNWSVDRRYGTTFNGTRTVIRSGTLTNVTARNPATNTPTALEDTSLADWSPYLAGGYMVAYTSGPASGYASFCAKNLGGGSVRVSTPLRTTNNAEGSPVAGNTYDVVKLTVISNFNVGNGYLGRTCIFNDLDFYSSPITANNASASPIRFWNCRLYIPHYFTNYARYSNCCFTVFVGYGGFSSLWGGLIYQTGTSVLDEIEYGQQVWLDKGTMFQGCQISVINGGYARIYDACVFDCDRDAVDMHAFGLVRAEVLFGSNNSGYGINVKGSGKLSINGTPKITGTSGDVRLHNTTYTWAAIAAASNYIQSTTSDACITPL